MKKFLLLPIIALASIFSSCEKIVDVEVPDGEIQLVVDAFLNDSVTKQYVRLTTTAPYFQAGQTPEATGATVNVTDLNNNKVYNFTYESNGNYTFTPQATDTFGVIGHTYQLNITYKGDTYKSTSVLKRTTKIDVIGFQYQDGTLPGSNGETGFLPYLFGQDKPGLGDKYWIRTYKNNSFFNTAANINVAEDGGGGLGTDGLCFIPPNAFFNVTPSGKLFQLGDVCKVEVYSLNNDTYDFLLQTQTQLTSSSAGLFAVTAQNLRTNIQPVNDGAKKALGFFNMGGLSSLQMPCFDNFNIVAGTYVCP